MRYALNELNFQLELLSKNKSIATSFPRLASVIDLWVSDKTLDYLTQIQVSRVYNQLGKIIRQVEAIKSELEFAPRSVVRTSDNTYEAGRNVRTYVPTFESNTENSTFWRALDGFGNLCEKANNSKHKHWAWIIFGVTVVLYLFIMSLSGEH